MYLVYRTVRDRLESLMIAIFTTIEHSSRIVFHTKIRPCSNAVLFIRVAIS